MKRSGDRVIGRSGDRKQNLTTEARRHGEESGKRIIPLSNIPSPVILRGAPRKILPRAGDGRAVEGLPAPGAFQRVANQARDICQLLLITLREIFDENAYERFLRRGQISRSVESYRAFLLEREEGIARKPRCC